MSVKSWLVDNGFSQFVELFEENEIDEEVLFELTDNDLVNLGIVLGPRKKLLKALANHSDRRSDQLTQGAGSEHAPAHTQPERRHVTVMFADMVGSTSLTAKLDPEEMREIIRGFQNAVAGEIARFKGHVSRFMGDGVLSYFGYPLAHEDDAERAVRSALAIADAVSAQSTPDGDSLSVRIGIASGLVVIGDLIGEYEAEERAVVGDTPNLASRLQSLAASGGIVIAPATRKLVADNFRLEDSGEFELKGLPDRVRPYAVLGVKDHESRFRAHHAEGLTTLVGREREQALITARWRQTCAGEGQMVMVTGEAGIGKSRIVQAVLGEIAPEEPMRITYQCSPHHSDRPFYPIIQHLQRMAGIRSDDTPDARFGKIKSLVGKDGEEAVLLADLLDVGGDGRYRFLEPSPTRRRAQTIQLLIDTLVRASRERPVLALFEDLHWVDPSTLEYLDIALDPFSRERVFVVATARPNFEHSFTGHPALTRLALNRLGRKHAEEIICHLAGGRSLPPALLDVITSRTDGVPLFIEELTKSVLEAGIVQETDNGPGLSGDVDTLPIPASLHDSLLARLDRLQPFKEVAQIAACIGREFDHSALAMLSDLSAERLQEALDGLTKAGLVFRRGGASELRYMFKHALVRDVAYESMLKARRLELHQRLLSALESAGEAAPAHTLAHHAQAAHQTEKAVDYWSKAARYALANSAYQEAIIHLRKGLKLLESLPESSKRIERALEFYKVLYNALTDTKGWGSKESTEIYKRIRDLGALTSETKQIGAQWLQHAMCGEHLLARAAAAEMLDLGERKANFPMMIAAHRRLGWTALYRGDLELVPRHIDESLNLCAKHNAPFPFDYQTTSNHPNVLGLCVRLYHQWLTGYPEQAFNTAREAVRYARELGHPHTLAYALTYSTQRAVVEGNAGLAAELAGESIELSEQHGFLLLHSWALMSAGWAAASDGERESGLSFFRQGLEAYTVGGQTLFRPFFLALIAELYLMGGQIQKARLAVDEARSLVERTGERMWEAEIHRLSGEILSVQQYDSSGQVEILLRGAIDTAHGQGAKSLELRAAISLARLLGGKRRNREARATLDAIYSKFTEGFDTYDLREARALLDSIGK